jgi:hypothetical protein
VGVIAGSARLTRADVRRYNCAVAIPARDSESPKPAERPPAPAAVRAPQSPPARALALQRAAGNRAARRVLSRWAKHPDPEQKGVMVPDSSAEEYGRFNPPKNE